jgi:hypothetical protein
MNNMNNMDNILNLETIGEQRLATWTLEGGKYVPVLQRRPKSIAEIRKVSDIVDDGDAVRDMLCLFLETMGRDSDEVELALLMRGAHEGILQRHGWIAYSDAALKAEKAASKRAQQRRNEGVAENTVRELAAADYTRLMDGYALKNLVIAAKVRRLLVLAEVRREQQALRNKREELRRRRLAEQAAGKVSDETRAAESEVRRELKELAVAEASA